MWESAADYKNCLEIAEYMGFVRVLSISCIPPQVVASSLQWPAGGPRAWANVFKLYEIIGIGCKDAGAARAANMVWLRALRGARAPEVLKSVTDPCSSAPGVAVCMGLVRRNVADRTEV